MSQALTLQDKLKKAPVVFAAYTVTNGMPPQYFVGSSLKSVVVNKARKTAKKHPNVMVHVTRYDPATSQTVWLGPSGTESLVPVRW